jgi:hypothetical protein
MTRIHSFMVIIMKMAASVDGERPAPNIPDSCKAFWSCSSSEVAKLELLEQLEHMGLRTVVFAHGLLVVLYDFVLQVSIIFGRRFAKQLIYFLLQKGKGIEEQPECKSIGRVSYQLTREGNIIG